MHTTLIQMTFLALAGIVWRLYKPLGLEAEDTRKVLTTVVYYFFLPVLVLDVLWRANIGWDSLQYTLLVVPCILFGMVMLWLTGKLVRFDNRVMGALILAAGFPNVTYLGLPVLEQTFGTWARSVVIQIDLFATAPLVFTLGIAVVRYYGEDTDEKPQPLWTFLNAPPFWAAGAAVILNAGGLGIPDWLSPTLKLISSAVVPLMLFSLGLALSWQSVGLKSLVYMFPVVLIKMLLMPVVAMTLVAYLTLDAPYKAAAVLDLAMPSMVIGIVLCDRYRLDSGLYALAVTVTTALSLLTLPFWYGVLGARYL